MVLEDFEPIFGEVKGEWAAPASPPLPPFLFHVHALGPSCLRVYVTDFHSNTLEAVRSVEQLEDMRDMIGIGGSWSEFIDYVISSLRSDNLKLILEGQPREEGAASAKFIAQRSKGMPLISIPLTKLVDVAAREAMAFLSLELHKSFKSTRCLLVHEQERCCQLMKVISAEREKSENIQRQLDTVLYSKRQKLQKMNNKAGSDALADTGSQESSDQLAAQNPVLTKVAKRIVPSHYRLLCISWFLIYYVFVIMVLML
ncbi:hypothetical protein NMG60_11007032 [Bertholletia excelsa]